MNILFLEESSHLSYMTKPLTIGGWILSKDKVKEINDEIKKIKLEHGIKARTELKWTKIGKSKIKAYKEIVNYVLQNNDMKLRVLVAENQESLNSSYKEWYFKLHYSLISKSPFTVGGVISDRKGKGNEQYIRKTIGMIDKKNHSNTPVKFIDSIESQIIQLSDIFLGAISSYDSEIKSKYKKEIFDLILESINFKETTSLFTGQTKYNIFHWGKK